MAQSANSCERMPPSLPHDTRGLWRCDKRSQIALGKSEGTNARALASLAGASDRSLGRCVNGAFAAAQVSEAPIIRTRTCRPLTLPALSFFSAFSAMFRVTAT